MGVCGEGDEENRLEREEVTGNSSKLDDDDGDDHRASYCSLNVTRMMKCVCGMRWAGHVALER